MAKLYEYRDGKRRAMTDKEVKEFEAAREAMRNEAETQRSVPRQAILERLGDKADAFLEALDGLPRASRERWYLGDPLANDKEVIASIKKAGANPEKVLAP